MKKAKTFDKKLLNRFDKIDKESLRPFVCDLVAENSLLRECLQDLSEGIAIASKESEIIYLNDAASKWLGIHSSLKTKKSLSDVEDADLKKFLAKAASSKKGKIVEDVQLLNPRETYLRIYVNDLESSEKDLKVIVLENRTDEVSEQMDEARITRIESLVSLAAGVAHEIGNPLNSLSIHLQMLNKKIKDIPEAKKKGLKESIEIMSSETRRLDKIIKNFLKATRKPPLRFKNEDLNLMVEEAIKFLKPELDANKIKLTFKKDSKLPSFLMDRDRLYQAYINLIKNAMESMPGGGKMSVQISHEKKIAIIRFKDEGKGINEKDLPHIFDVYYTTKEEGAGLGMMTVYDAVSEHGGRIDVVSKLNKGTTFTLLIPMRQPKLQLPSFEIKN